MEQSPSVALIRLILAAGCLVAGIRSVLLRQDCFIDLYKPVTGNAGNYQVKNARNGMMLIVGGPSATNCVFIIGIEQ